MDTIDEQIKALLDKTAEPLETLKIDDPQGQNLKHMADLIMTTRR